jgi:poly(3-hydroxybutyrate) depolymerase
VSGVLAGGHSYIVTSYLDHQGGTVAQLWTIRGMGHAGSGGSSDAAVVEYADPGGPSAAAASAAFFLHWRLADGAAACTR